MLTALDKIIRLRPRGAGAYAMKAALLAQLGDYREALKNYDTAVSLDPLNAQLYLNRSTIKFLTGDIADSAEDLTVALQLNPQLAQAYYNRGVANVNLSRYLPAEKDFAAARDLFAALGDAPSLNDADKALKAVREFSRLSGARGAKKAGARGSKTAAAAPSPKELVSIKRDNADLEKSKSALISSLGADSKSALEKFKAASAVNRQGEMPGLGELGNYEVAVRKTMADNKEKIKDSPKTALDYKADSQKKLAAGDIKGAIADLDKAIEKAPDNASFYLDRARAHASDKDARSAIADLDKALERDPANASGLYQRGQQKALLGDNKGAQADFAQAEDLYTKQGKPYDAQQAWNAANLLQGRSAKTMKGDDTAKRIFNEASQDFEKGDYKAARDKFDQIIRLQPNESGNYYNRGLTNMHIGDKDAALNDFNRAIGLNPADSKALMGRANILSDKGEFGAAHKDLEAVKKLIPDDPNAYLTSGLLNAREGNFDATVRDADAAIGLDDTNAYAYEIRAGAYASKLPLEQDKINSDNIDAYINNFTNASNDFAQAKALAQGNKGQIEGLVQKEQQAKETLEWLRRYKEILKAGK
jgi:tetratricopeptide (TPR) repeat protein